MLYVIVPNNAKWRDLSYFVSYSAMEQFVLNFARIQMRLPSEVAWCEIYAYDGTDELHPIFKYTIHPELFLERTTL